MKFGLRRLLLVISTVAACLFLAGCAGGGDAPKKETKPLRVASSVDFAPFEFQVDNKKDYQGFDMDLIRAIGHEMGRKVDIVNITFDDLLKTLEEKKIDVVISGVSITPERQKKVLFSDAYYESGLTIVVRADDKSVEKFEDLNGKRIAVQLGTTGAEEAKKLKDAKVTELETASICFMQMKEGKVDAIINDRPVNDYFISQGFDGVRVLKDRLSLEYYGIAVNRDNTALKKEIDAALVKLKEKGEYQKIFDKWFKAKKQAVTLDITRLTYRRDNALATKARQSVYPRFPLRRLAWRQFRMDWTYISANKLKA